MSFDKFVTHFAWMADSIVYAKSSTRYASADSYKTWNTVAPKWYSVLGLRSCVISWTIFMNDNLGIRKSMFFWYFLISLKAFTPCWNICFLNLGGPLGSLATYTSSILGACPVLLLPTWEVSLGLLRLFFFTYVFFILAVGNWQYRKGCKMQNLCRAQHKKLTKIVIKTKRAHSKIWFFSG